MKLTEVFTQLAYGELSQLSMMANGPDKISDANQMALANHVNLGLTALYKRFKLKERRTTFPLQEGVDTYALELPDLLKIERVVCDLDYDLPLNKESDPYSVFTPILNYVRVPLSIVNQDADLPAELVTDNLTVVYRSNHPRIDLSLGYVDADATELELPTSHLEALLLFVAMRTNQPLGVGQYEGIAGNSYRAKYEAECQRLEQQNVEIDESSDMGDRLRDKGFV